MATDDKKRFELGKGSDHKFDINKGAKRQFDLHKDEEEPAPVAASEAQGPEPELTPQDLTPQEAEVVEEAKKSRPWLWVLIVVLIAAIICFLFLPGNDEEPAQPETQPTESVTPTDDAAAVPAEAQEAAREGVPAPAPASEATPSQPASRPAVTATGAAGSVEQEALNVIRGQYGNGQARREALGSRYGEIQARVNQLMKQGRF